MLCKSCITLIIFSIPSKTPKFLLEADLGRRSKPILKYRYQGNIALVFKGDVHHSIACFDDLGQPRVMLIIAVGATDLKKQCMGSGRETVMVSIP